jgi:hypothetical protein
MTIAAFQKRISSHYGQRIAWSAKDIARIAAHYGVDAKLAELPHPPEASRRAPPVVFEKDAASEDMTAHFIASDGSVDRMGDNDQSGRLAARLIQEKSCHPICA